jgi:hypothetical protein
MRRRLVLLVSIAFIALVFVWLLVFHRGGDNNVQPASTPVEIADAIESATTTAAEPYEKLVGRWRRDDGGYVLEIGGVDADGKLKVGYFNPKPINVSRAEYAGAGDSLAVFVELTDVGYPGATYRLIYEANRDILIGLYTQPSANQTFDVHFARMP